MTPAATKESPPDSSIDAKLASLALNSSSFTDLHQRFVQCGQGHVFSSFKDLPADAQSSFLAHLARIDPERVCRIHAAAISAAPDPAQFSPLPPEICVKVNSDAYSRDAARFRCAGLDAIRQGKVALLLLAGGQGTRLGSAAPKGCYDIGLPSKKSLFQLQAERYLRIQTLAKASNVPWYIMVSGPTRADTVKFFETNNFFGIDRKNVVFFEQGTLPAIDSNGKFIMEARDRLALAPDGNGGMYKALEQQGILKDMQQRKICYVHAYCVDNCLVKVLDPEFIGFCISKGCDVAAKTVAKSSPDEAVGVVCLKDGKYAVAEYSEIPKALAHAVDPNTKALLYGAANIANHFYTLNFLAGIPAQEAKLAFHIAHKKIPQYDHVSGTCSAPTSPNGVKLELFIFDVFPLCTKFAVFEGLREEEFSPLKNKSGPDSASTSRRDIMCQSLRFLKAAGAVVDPRMFSDLSNCKDDDSKTVCEISPLISYSGEGLESFKGKSVQFPVIIDRANL